MLDADDLYYALAVTGPGARRDLSRLLSSLLVEEDEGVPSALHATFSDEHRLLSDALHEGVELELDLGAASEHSIVFRGRAYQVDADFPHRGVATVEVHAYDASMRMGLRRRNRALQGTLSSVVEHVADGYAFTEVSVDLVGDPAFGRNGIRQQDETDLAFLRRLADDHGCVCYLSTEDDGDRLHFRARAKIAEQSPDAALRYGSRGAAGTLLAFEAHSDVADVELPRTMSAVDYDSGAHRIETSRELDSAAVRATSSLRPRLTSALIEEDAVAPGSSLLVELLEEAPSTSAGLRAELGPEAPRDIPTFLGAEALKARAANVFSSSARGMRGGGATAGEKDLRAQRIVDIDGVGDHFSGAWYLTSVRHRLDRGGYRTDFECRR